MSENHMSLYYVNFHHMWNGEKACILYLCKCVTRNADSLVILHTKCNKKDMKLHFTYFTHFICEMPKNCLSMQKRTCELFECFRTFHISHGKTLRTTCTSHFVKCCFACDKLLVTVLPLYKKALLTFFHVWLIIFSTCEISETQMWWNDVNFSFS